MTKSKWLNLGSVRKGRSGNTYIQLGSPKDKYNPVTVELIVKDPAGNVLAKVENPALNTQNPRKRPGVTEEQLAKIPEFLLANVTLPPAKE